MKGFVPNRPKHEVSSSAGPQEDELDALLVKIEEKRVQKEQQAFEAQADPIDIFRTKMRQVYAPIFEDIRSKYLAKGLEMEMDAEEFLGGGTSLRFRFTFRDIVVELDGTVMRGGVAFYIVRSTGENKGAVVSGPMLRIRNLNGEEFRQFIIGHLSELIKEALRHP